MIENDKIGHRKRAREKFIKSNSDSIADYEILEILLFSSNPRKDVKSIAKSILKHFKSLNKLINASEEELKAMPNIQDSVLSTIKAIKEIVNRILLEKAKDSVKLANWASLVKYIKQNIGFSKIENFMIIFLNANNIIINTEIDKSGTVDKIIPFSREIIKKALNIGTTSLVIAHNHPSDDTQPSQGDIEFTLNLAKCCVAVNIELVDHIIVSENSEFSFMSHGLL